MATKFEELVNGMVNVGFGAAAVTAEKGKELLDGLNARGEEVLRDLNDRGEPGTSRQPFVRFHALHVRYLHGCRRHVLRGDRASERAWGHCRRAHPRRAHSRPCAFADQVRARRDFMAHVRDLSNSVDDGTVTVEVEETVVVDAEPAAPVDAEPVEDGQAVE